MTAVIQDPGIRCCASCGGEVRAKGLSTCTGCTASELGITYRQLDNWVRRGWLHPQRTVSRRGTSGSGTVRHWPPAELDIARRMARLTAAGIAPERAAVFARDSWPSGEVAPGIRLEVTP